MWIRNEFPKIQFVIVTKLTPVARLRGGRIDSRNSCLPSLNRPNTLLRVVTANPPQMSKSSTSCNQGRKNIAIRAYHNPSIPYPFAFH